MANSSAFGQHEDDIGFVALHAYSRQLAYRESAAVPTVVLKQTIDLHVGQRRQRHDVCGVYQTCTRKEGVPYIKLLSPYIKLAL